ncbi:alpha-mannosidase 2-like [Mercenaria mercenaria]|uniref:alpha-mannosidase 2-like n=1 Tax=Mercenaria mercenaria TaxID=6596 RepID=UPI00234E38BE|nr:alpha-mannosidase 2-like [Mercenaria mercenaria]
MNKMISVRKCLFRLCILYIGVLTLLFIFMSHIYITELMTDVLKQEILMNDSKPEIAIDFTVNDVLDHIIHERHGHFVSSKCIDKLNITRNPAKRNFSTEPLKVIVVPHSHNDPGYKKTFSEYFTRRTSKILSLVVEKLYKYHDMTFVWPEICFIEKWWNNQNKTIRNKFKYLVKSGRLELTSGAWVIPDEATPHYFAYLDQMIEGHVWVKRHFGVKPVATFDMDQFSLSSSVRFLMKEAGIKFAVVKRIHLGMKDYFMKHHLMNFYWKTPSDQTLFVQIEPYEWLSFPDSCGPSRDICSDLDLGHDIELPGPGSLEMDKPIRLFHHRYSNLSTFADRVVEQLKLKSSGYLHNVLLLPHGDDFRYNTADEWDWQYKNTKALMQFINSNKRYNVRMEFGTLKDYFAEVKTRSEIYRLQYPIISGDFVPFTQGLYYWSGFFTTRQYLKRLGRKLQESVRAADILAALLVLSGKVPEMSLKKAPLVLRKLVDARRELDLFQHHDAITGTSSERVVKDYEKRLLSALFTSQQVMASLVELIIYGSRTDTETENGDAANENYIERDILQSPRGKSVVPTSIENMIKKESDVGRSQNIEKDTNLILYNDFTQERSEIVAFSVSSPYIVITGPTGANFSFDFFRQGERSKIYFETRLPPLSISSFKISKSHHSVSGKAIDVSNYDTRDTSDTGNLKCENSEVNITFSSYDGSPQIICYKSENFCTKLKIYWRHFIQTGGAYTLSLSSESKNLLTSRLNIRKLSGSKQCVVEVSHKLIKVEYMLKNTTGVNGRYLQVNVHTDLSPANSGNFVGELAMRVVTQVRNGDTFYTDSNSLQLLKRKFRKSLPFSANVYPISSMAAIKDDSQIFNIHSVQPHGVVGWEPGTLDVMIDRVALRTEMGLNQKVTDNKPTLTNLFLHFEQSENIKPDSKSDVMIPSRDSMLTNDLVQHPIESFYSREKDPLQKTAISFVQKNIPCEMVIANMKFLTDDKYELDGVSLTLFRRSTSGCNTVATHCGVQSKYALLSPDNLFEKSSRKNWTVKEMYLTHLKLKRTLSVNENVSFEEMDMKTFLFT